MNWIVTCNLCKSSYVYASGQGLPDLCSVCAEKGKKESKKFLDREKKRKEVVAFTLSELPDREIEKTLGLVSHEEILAVGLGREPDLETFRGGTGLAWADKVRSARELCLRAIKDETVDSGGNAVLGVDFACQVLGTFGDMIILLIGVKGTAVFLG